MEGEKMGMCWWCLASGGRCDSVGVEEVYLIYILEIFIKLSDYAQNSMSYLKRSTGPRYLIEKGFPQIIRKSQVIHVLNSCQTPYTLEARLIRNGLN
jgi:hypothetical protein